MVDTIQGADVLRFRMQALGLTGARHTAHKADSAQEAPTGPQRIGEAASHMLAVQGQDWRSSRWALGLRAPGTTVRDVATAFTEGRVVRSWPARGTLHTVAAEDIGWMQQATNHRVLAGAAARREALGMSDTALERLVEVSLAALRDSPGLARDELADAWTGAGIEWQSMWRYHLIWWLCQNGLATFGPVREHASGAHEEAGVPETDSEPLLVEASAWIRSPRRLEGDDALAELAARYAAARGPIRPRDFAWWTGLTMREARHGIAAASEQGRLVELRQAGIDGAAGELWADPELLSTTPELAGMPEWLLLPAFDEHLLGYTEREAQLDPQHFERIVPGRNGMFLATIVRRGRVVGTWKRRPGKRVRVELQAFPGARLSRARLEQQLKKWAAFHGYPDAALALA